MAEVKEVHFSCNIDSDDDQISNYPTTETIRMLKSVITQLEAGQGGGTIHDINGNHAGRFDFVIVYEKPCTHNWIKIDGGGDYCTWCQCRKGGVL